MTKLKELIQFKGLIQLKETMEESIKQYKEAMGKIIKIYEDIKKIYEEEKKPEEKKHNYIKKFVFNIISILEGIIFNPQAISLKKFQIYELNKLEANIISKEVNGEFEDFRILQIQQSQTNTIDNTEEAKRKIKSIIEQNDKKRLKNILFSNSNESFSKKIDEIDQIDEEERNKEEITDNHDDNLKNESNDGLSDSNQKSSISNLNESFDKNSEDHNDSNSNLNNNKEEINEVNIKQLSLNYPKTKLFIDINSSYIEFNKFFKKLIENHHNNNMHEILNFQNRYFRYALDCKYINLIFKDLNKNNFYLIKDSNKNYSFQKNFFQKDDIILDKDDIILNKDINIYSKIKTDQEGNQLFSFQELFFNYYTNNQEIMRIYNNILLFKIFNIDCLVRDIFNTSTKNLEHYSLNTDSSIFDEDILNKILEYINSLKNYSIVIIHDTYRKYQYYINYNSDDNHEKINKITQDDLKLYMANIYFEYKL